jgi:thiol-disulfide isomerase/thioredoxin
LGDDEMALEVINDALKLRPDARDSLMLKGKILQVLGRTKEAEDLLEDAAFLPEGNWSEHVAINATTIAADLMLDGLDDKTHQFSDFIGKGKWTILNIWGPKCPPCIEEMPQLQAFHDDHKDSDATVIGLAIDYPTFGYAKKAEVKKFAELNNISYRILLGDSDIVSKFGGGKLLAVPTTLAWSPEDELKMSHVGLITADLLEQYILGKDAAR